MTNEEVVRSWVDSYQGDTLNLHTDGVDLFSYALRIGTTTPDGDKVVFPYNTAGLYISRTTSRHVNLAASVPGTRWATPDEFKAELESEYRGWRQFYPELYFPSEAVINAAVGRWARKR